MVLNEGKMKIGKEAKRSEKKRKEASTKKRKLVHSPSGGVPRHKIVMSMLTLACQGADACIPGRS
jgi:DNA helicase TIP49 (TBP-interacting protein)